MIASLFRYHELVLTTFPCSRFSQLPGFLHVLQTLVAEVRVVQHGIMPAGSQQPLVVALFDDLAVLHHDDAVG